MSKQLVEDELKSLQKEELESLQQAIGSDIKSLESEISADIGLESLGEVVGKLNLKFLQAAIETEMTSLIELQEKSNESNSYFFSKELLIRLHLFRDIVDTRLNSFSKTTEVKPELSLKAEIRINEIQLELDEKQPHSEIEEDYGIVLEIPEYQYSSEDPEISSRSEASFVEVEEASTSDELENNDDDQDNDIELQEYNEALDENIQRMVEDDKQQANRASYSGGIIASFWKNPSNHSGAATTHNSEHSDRASFR